MTINQKVAAILEVAFSTRELTFGLRNLILADAAKAAGLKLWNTGHGKHGDIIHFELCSGRRTLVCFQ